MKNRFFLLLALLICWPGSTVQLSAQDLTLGRLFSDHMVLQQNADVTIWGSAAAGERVSVTLGNSKSSVTASKDGAWKVLLQTPSAGGPYVLEVEAGSDHLSVKDVMVGEVWVASGQSNMAFQVRRAMNAQEEVAAAAYPGIRFFTLPDVVSNVPRDEVPGGNWQVCSPETAGDFSAVAYFFSREIHQYLDVPVGVIVSAWGGTPSESFTSYEMHTALGEFDCSMKSVDPTEFARMVEKNSKNNTRKQELKRFTDAGLKKGVNQVNYDDGNWNTMAIPIHFHNTRLKGYKGYVWFRKTIQVPASWRKKELTLFLGKIEQQDVTYLNGKEIGKCDDTQMLREYPIPAGTLVKGKNVIAVRVMHDREEGGGFWQGPFKLVDKSTGEVLLDLSGPWKYNENIEPPFPEVVRYELQPAMIYNAMINPLIPYSIRGVIWYQGENNASRAAQYRRIFPAMIQDWRIHWGEGYFPFLYVQLANFLEKDKQPTSDPWPYLREAQTMALRLPNTAMASAIDIGEANDIHPKNKQEVGRRLALAAKNMVYGEDILYSGPMMKDYEIRDGSFYITFRDVGEGLELQNFDTVKGFAVAGADRVFHWAQAEIIGKDRVRVWSDEVQDPVAVRYDWSNNPDASLYNSAGLPAVSFRTDQWEQ